MNEIPEFPPLTEGERRLMVNALMIAGGQFGTAKIDRGGLWADAYNALTVRLGFSGKGWDVPAHLRQPKCAHGVGPAFLDGPGGRVNQRAANCWECEGEAYRERIEQLEAETRRYQDWAKKAEAELNETWYEPEGHGPDAWRRPTAEAYGRVCVLYRKAEERLKKLDQAQGFASNPLLVKNAYQYADSFPPLKEGEEPTHSVVLAAHARALEARLNAPELKDFAAAVVLEAAHQRERWGEAHDSGKGPEDWLWLVAYLATKAAQARRYGDSEKYVHHIITTAAACANWHAYETGAERMGTPAPERAPVPLVMFCPAGHPHVDEGEWATRPHKTHKCQYPECPCRITNCAAGHKNICGREWRPAEFPTVGVPAET